MNWIPALLWRYLNIAPYPTTWLITLVQSLSVGISVYILTLAIAKERAVAVLAVIFAYVAGLWGWNPANYGSRSDAVFGPYPAHLAIAPVLLAFACLLRGRDKAALLLLSVAGLIHPNLALYACAIVGIYWLWEGSQNRSPATLRRLAGLMVVGIITVLPALFVNMTLPGDPLPHAELIAGMRHNQHIWPWGYGRWKFSLPTTLKWLVLAILGWRRRPRFSDNVCRLWLAALVGGSVVSLSHVVGGIWQIPLLLNLIGLRSPIWLAFISLPLVMHYWYAHIRSGGWLGAVLSMLCLALPLYAREYALFWPLIIGLLLVDASQGHLSAWNFDLPMWGRRGLWTIALCVLIAWSASFLAMPFDFEETPSQLLETVSQLMWQVKGALPEQTDRLTLVVTIALLGLMVWGFGWLRRTTRITLPIRCRNALWSVLMGLMIVLYGSRFLWMQWQAVEDERVSSVYTLDVQLWARENTPTSSLFAVPETSWRTMSLRRKLSPFTRESYAYIAPRQAKEHRERLLGFYGISAEEGEELRGAEISRMERDRFRSFRESDFLRFASEFGATHLVLPKDMQTKALALPLVYENPCYLVYSLDSSLVESMRRQQKEQDEATLREAMGATLLHLDFSAIETEGSKTYVVARTGQKATIKGPAHLADGPFRGSKALVVDETTRLIGPTSGIDLSQGSLSVWARLTDPGKDYSTLVRVNDTKDLVILHRGWNGRLIVSLKL